MGTVVLLAVGVAAGLAAALAQATFPDGAPAAHRDGAPPAEDPLHYAAPRAATHPEIDGRLDDEAWAAAPWTSDFVDIEGSIRPLPRFRTRAKIVWDETRLYIGAELEEPHVWGTLTERDAVIFHDDDFEVFLDPDPETPGYYELEVNALGTVWDLYLTRPYREGGQPVDAWDINGLMHAIQVDGSLNDPSDLDRGWTVELSIPWAAMAEATASSDPARRTWRINFSRVDWDMEITVGGYAKRTGADGEALPERNWVWSPQGEINMHIPERWGFVSFVEQGP